MQEATTANQLPAATLALLSRHAAWWQKKGLLYAETPGSILGDLWLPLSNGSTAQQDVYLTPEMLDLERAAYEQQEQGPLQFWGDLIQTQHAFTRIPWVEAVLGCPIRASIQGGSMRAERFISGWDSRPEPTGDGARWLSLLRSLVNMLVKRSGGRYAVSHTLMRGPSDLAEAALGPELMCLSQYEHPARLRSFIQEATQLFISVWRAQMELIPPLADGYVNWFGIWAPGTVVRTQCDASALLSPAQYRDWYLPFDLQIAAAADYAVIHLHSGSLHTVEPLLEIETPQAIQVSLDPQPSGPPLERLLPVFSRVLQVKPLIVDGELNTCQVRSLLDGLPHDGLCIIARGNPAEVDGL